MWSQKEIREGATANMTIYAPWKDRTWQLSQTQQILITWNLILSSPKSFFKTGSRKISYWDADSQENVYMKPFLSALSHQASLTHPKQFLFSSAHRLWEALPVKDKLLRRSRAKSIKKSFPWLINRCLSGKFYFSQNNTYLAEFLFMENCRPRPP
jgi:hypothetical protein